MTLRDLIIKARIKSGITQGELAEKAGLSQPQISDFESGKREMRSDNLDKVLSVLNLTLNTYEKTYLIIYRDMNVATKTGKRRTEEVIKDLFWNEVPENWDQFDGEIIVRHHEAFGIKDAAILVFNNKYWDGFVIDKLSKRRDIYKIEEL